MMGLRPNEQSGARRFNLVVLAMVVRSPVSVRSLRPWNVLPSSMILLIPVDDIYCRGQPTEYSGTLSDQKKEDVNLCYSSGVK